MRRAALIPVMLLGLGGIALAQPRTIVDPWAQPAHAVSSSSAAFPIESLSSDVPPVASGLGGPDERAKISRPWSPVPAVASGLDSDTEATPKARPPSRPRIATWSARCKEIVQPWQRMPKLAAIDVPNLIVDPWAPSVRRAQRELRDSPAQPR